MGPKSEKLQFRLTEEEDDAFRREAQKKGISVSEWLRQLGRREAGLGSMMKEASGQ